MYRTLLFLVLIGCNDGENGDGTKNGAAFVTGHLYLDEIEVSSFVTLTGSDGSATTGATGETIEVPVPGSGSESFTVEFGDPGTLGCDGQALHPSGSEFYMALTEDLELADGDTVEVTASPFDYYEWSGPLACTAWDDYGWSEDYATEEPTANGKTCVDADGELDLDEMNVTFDFSGGTVTSDLGDIYDFVADADGFYANLEDDSYMRCDVQ